MASAAGDDSLQPIQILIDELRSEDVQVRLNSIRRLSTIARALGPERTRTELVPFLTESTDDEEEVLVALAEELANLAGELIGGADHIPVLYTALSQLANSEETAVRDKAVDSLRRISVHLSETLIADGFVSLVTSLATSEWFTSRASSAGLFPTVYARVSDQSIQSRLRQLFSKLGSDEIPLVRKAAASNFAKLANAVDNNAAAEIVNVFKALANDEQDSARLLIVEACGPLVDKLPTELSREHIQPIARSFCHDKSWRVRYMAAMHICSLVTAAGPQSKDEMTANFLKLLTDTEAEVRTMAASRIADFAGLVSEQELSSKILPITKQLATDSSEHVRAALAAVVMTLAPMLGKERTIDTLLDIFLRLLKDEVPEVRLNVISKLDAVNRVIGIELLSQSLLPAIVELAEDRQWRVRMAIIEYVPLLSAQLGVEFFNEKLSQLSMTWLGDSVYSVREAAIGNLTKLIKLFGTEWAQSTIIPKVLNLHSHANYLFRLTCLFAISSFTEVTASAAIESAILPIVIKMSADPVPNIRFNVAKTLQAICAKIDRQVVLDRVKPALQALLDDQDRDVKFYAGQALQLI